MKDLSDAISECNSKDASSESLKMRRLDEPENYSRSMEETAQGLSREIERFGRGSTRLIELFSVQFVDYKQVNLEKIYGLMMLDCAAKPYVLFERCPGDPLPVDSNGFVKLTGPSHVHVAFDCIDFMPFISDLEGHVVEYVDNLWKGSYRNIQRYGNMLLSKRRDTIFGPIELNFAVFRNSAQANVELKLSDWKGNGKCNLKNTDFTKIKVFGTVTARTKIITDDRATSYMFKREKDECVLVRLGEAIPLSKFCVACPNRSSIILDVHLCHCSDNDSASEGDDLIVNGRVEVPVTLRDEEFVLKGDCASVQLNITWYTT